MNHFYVAGKRVTVEKIKEGRVEGKRSVNRSGLWKVFAKGREGEGLDSD